MSTSVIQPSHGVAAPPFQQGPTWVAPTIVEGPPVLVASLRRRLAAYVIDSFVINFIQVFVVGFGVVLIGLIAAATPDDAAIRIALILPVALLYLAVPFGALVVLPSRAGAWNGQTIGKRAMGIKAVRADGNALGFKAALLRATLALGTFWIAILIGAAIDAIVGTDYTFTFFLMIFVVLYYAADVAVMPLRGELRRTVHDRVADTIVIRTPNVIVPAGVELTPGPLTGRPKTAVTYAASSIVGLVLVSVSLFYLYLFAFDPSSFRSEMTASTATSQPVAPQSGAPSSAAPSSVAPQYAAPGKAASLRSITLSPDDGERHAMSIAYVLGEQLARCYTAAGNDVSRCKSDRALHLPAGTLDPIHSPNRATPDGEDTYPGEIVTAPAREWKTSGRAIGVFDGRGLFWGFVVTDGGRLTSVCKDTLTVRCAGSTNQRGENFLYSPKNDQILNSTGVHA